MGAFGFANLDTTKLPIAEAYPFIINNEVGVLNIYFHDDGKDQHGNGTAGAALYLTDQSKYGESKLERIE